MASSDTAERVSSNDGQPFFDRAAFDRPEAECDGEEREDERRDDADSARVRAHQDYAYGQARCDDEYLRGTQQDIYGAYQANFLFLEAQGVSTSTSLEGPRYVALVRTGDGRLAIPGAMPTQ